MIEPGDIGFAHSTGMMGRLIRFGEFLRARRGAAWNHQFIVDRFENDSWYVIQATLHGVTNDCRLDDVAPEGKIIVMSPPKGVNRTRALAFARAQVGIGYGFLTIVAIAFDIVTWDWVPSVRAARKPSWICSALVNESLRYGGWLHEWLDIYSVTPAQSYDALNKQPD